MRSMLDEIIFEVGKVDALLYAFEQCYLDIEPGPDDFEKMEKGSYAFYAIWDAIQETKTLLNKLYGECMVVDAIEAASKTKCENCTLKK